MAEKKRDDETKAEFLDRIGRTPEDDEVIEGAHQGIVEGAVDLTQYPDAIQSVEEGLEESAERAKSADGLLEEEREAKAKLDEEQAKEAEKSTEE